MAGYEYIKIPLRWFPLDILDQYKIVDLVEKDIFVNVNIRNSMYCLNQAAGTYFDPLVKILKIHGFCPFRSNPGSWCHETLTTKFTLFVDDFGIKYTNAIHDHHLVDTL